MDKETILREYKEYLEGLVRNNSDQVFTNGGVEYASILMSILFSNTKRNVRMYCQGFKPDLIKTEPYWTALGTFLSNPEHRLKVLVETDEYTDAQPMQRLFEVKNQGNQATVEVRKISDDGKDLLKPLNGGKPCNFAVFDDKMFRLEYEPDNYKALGSFNMPENSNKLADIFDRIFINAEEVTAPQA